VSGNVKDKIDSGRRDVAAAFESSYTSIMEDRSKSDLINSQASPGGEQDRKLSLALLRAFLQDEYVY
jgi:hypothetical protein